MDRTAATLAELSRDLVRLDSRSSVSNIPVADRIEPELRGFDIERVDYADAAGVPKRVLVANRGGPGGIAFSGHMDTVPDTGWDADPWSGRIDERGVLFGLGSADMKGPVAAAIVAARSLPDTVPVTLLITTDEETTKRGARAIAEQSAMVRVIKPKGILVVEPTSLRPVRGHRSHILFTCTAEGVQAHSSTGKGRNANWTLVPFLAELKSVYDRLLTDRTLQDDAYDPPFSDFNVIIDNHGAAVNVTVPLATAAIKFRYSAGIDPSYVRQAVAAAGVRFGVTVRESEEGSPPELPPDHPFVQACSDIARLAPATAPFGTDASILQSIAPCVIMGPGDIGVAHKPNEFIAIDDLVAAVPMFQALALRFA